MTERAECRFCHRWVVNDPNDGWVDPEATGDDVMWRETCEAHDTFEAEHEPLLCPSCGTETVVVEHPIYDPVRCPSCGWESMTFAGKEDAV